MDEQVRKQTQSLKKKTLAGFFWKFLESVSTQLVSFVVSIVLARILLPEQYGDVAIVTIFIALANVLVTNGLGTSLVQKKDATEEDFSTIFYSGIALSLVLYLILYITAPLIAHVYNNDAVTDLLRVMGVQLPISAIDSVQQAKISRKMEFRNLFYSSLLGAVISGVVGIAMAYGGAGVWALVAQSIINKIVNTIVLFVILRWLPSRTFSIESAKELLGFGSKLMFTGFIGTLFNNLKSLIIGARYTSADLAYYNKGESFPTLLTNNIDTTISTVMLPVLSQFQGDNRLMVEAISRFLKTCSYIIMPLMVGLAITADNVVTLLLTDKWSASVPFVQVICIQQMISILNTANLQSVKAKGEGDVMVKLELIKKPIMLVILFLAMPYGPMAICVGVTVYEFVAATLNAWPSARLFDYSLGDQLMDIAPNTFIAVMMGAIVWGIGLLNIGNILLELIVQILVGVISYIGLSIICKNESFGYVCNIIKEVGHEKAGLG